MIILTLIIVIEGITKEWLHGCGYLLRPLGHAGLFFALVSNGILDGKTGSIFTASMTYLLSFFITRQVESTIFRICAFWIFKNNYSFESLVLTTAFLFIKPPDETLIEDLFAHAGHIALYASSSSSSNSTSFFLASCICFFFLMIHSNIIAQWLVILSTFTFSLSFEADYNNILIQPWIDRPLWKCRFGIFGTFSFIFYSITLLISAFHDECSNSSQTLYAIHVGGILAVSLLIYPQVSAKYFKFFKLIICLAAILDAMLCILKIYSENYNTVSICRAFFALCCFASTLLIKQPDTDIQCLNVSFEHINYMKLFRLIGVLTYIAISFIQHVFKTSSVESFGQITHFCFIIGGIATEAVFWNDKLMTRIVQILICFEVIGTLWEYTEILYILKSLVLFISLPFNTHSIKNVFSF